MVSPQNPLKRQADLLDDGQRLELVRLALQGEPRLKACDYEFRLPRPSYTWNTLQALARDCPGHTFTLLIGGDNWARFGQWYRHEDILRQYPVVVYPRRGSAIDKALLPRGVRVVETPLLDISSTAVRERLRQGRSVRGLVPAAVASVIEQRHLFSPSSPGL